MQCGAPLVAAGRFCSNCGSPVAPVTLRTTSPAPPPDTDPTAYVDPYESLYASPAAAVAQPPPAAAPTSSLPLADEPPTPTPEELPSTPNPPSGSPGPGLWIGAVVLLVAVLVLGFFLLLQGSGDDTPSSASSPALVPKPHPSSQSAASRPSSSAPSSAATSAAPAPKGKATEVAGLALASAPRNAPPGVDFSGQPVTYVPANMVDGRPDTCWRVSGDATGMELTFQLAQPTKLSQVGLINGYDKIAFSNGRSYDWYAGNRRVMSVEWVFDDGTVVPQQLGFSRAMQRMTIEPVTTQTVRVRLTSVSPPGHGPAARNDTAVSEVSLKGVVG
jgi:hypothetical protein